MQFVCDLKSFASCAPDLEHDVDHNHRQTGPNRQNYFLTIVSDNRAIVVYVWIGIEKLVSSSPDKKSREQKDDHRDGERDSQRRNASLFNHRHRRRYLVADESVHFEVEEITRTEPCRSPEITMILSGGVGRRGYGDLINANALGAKIDNTIIAATRELFVFMRKTYAPA
jgi:hypothetical protein